jgi:hypothetical protein
MKVRSSNTGQVFPLGGLGGGGCGGTNKGDADECQTVYPVTLFRKIAEIHRIPDSSYSTYSNEVLFVWAQKDWEWERHDYIG